MKEITISTCEKNFILQAATKYKRLDGRKLDEFRKQNIYFGTDWGLCYATLGETKVLTQVTCEVQQPKTTRPNEGLLFINVELHSMAAPNFESGRGSDLSNHLNRFLEKCIKDSKAVDLESLCLVAEEKVWALRVDVNILNHDGNLIECASVCALAALAHFKRPDVTSDGQNIIIHDITERDPIPITIHHFPVCIAFALLNNGENVLADPTSIEERVSDASLIFGVNAYEEICGLHLGGNAFVEPKLILTCSRKAAAKAKELVDLIKLALKKDTEARVTRKGFGLVECVYWEKIKSMSEGRLQIQLNKFDLKKNNNIDQKNLLKAEQNDVALEVVDLGDNCAELIPHKEDRPAEAVIKQSGKTTGKITENEAGCRQLKEEDFARLKESSDYGEGGPSKWEIVDNVSHAVMEDSDSNSDREVHVLAIPPKMVENIVLSEDSEEEVVVLQSKDIENPSATCRNNKKMKSSFLREPKAESRKTSKSSESKTAKKRHQFKK